MLIEFNADYIKEGMNAQRRLLCLYIQPQQLNYISLIASVGKVTLEM